jgi:hypothetical protein
MPVIVHRGTFYHPTANKVIELACFTLETDIHISISEESSPAKIYYLNLDIVR